MSARRPRPRPRPRAAALAAFTLAAAGCGSGWERVESGTDRTLQAVWAGGPDEAWAVGAEGTVLRWDGRAWRRVDAGKPDARYTAVVGIAPGVACLVDEGRETASSTSSSSPGTSAASMT